MTAGANPDLVALLRHHRRLLIFTGAGISTGSGIPDFRGPGGVWTTQRPVMYQDFIASEAARLAHWEYKLAAADAFLRARPNVVHEAIVRLERAGRIRRIVTQNIDGLHQKAGSRPERVVELHGTNAEVECLDCGHRAPSPPILDHFRATQRPPVCEDCGGPLKIATISFGQALRPADVRAAEQAALTADMVVALGSSLSVYPAAAIPKLAAERGVPYVIINRGPTGHDGDADVTLRLEGDVMELFPPAVDRALGGGPSSDDFEPDGPPHATPP
jgi:NAD-dependent deacetylase